MKKLLTILSIFLTLSVSAQLSAPKVWNFRTSDVGGRKPVNADFYGKSVYCNNTANNIIWIRVNGVIKEGFVFYPAQDTNTQIYPISITSNARYAAPYYQNSVKTTTQAGYIPTKDKFTSPNTFIINWADSSAYQLIRGVVTKTWRIYVYDTSSVAPPAPELPTLNTRIYVSVSGSDSSLNAHNPATPYRTITKVNAIFSSLSANDSILFKGGETFAGTITASRDNIYIGKYGTGKPIISGFQTVTGWTNEGGGIYSKAISAQSAPNIVTVNGVNTPKGRWPNPKEIWGGYLNIDAHVGMTSITASEFNSNITNWTGAEIVFKRWRWRLDKSVITAHSGSTLTITDASGEIKDNFGCFVQNDTRTFDIVGDWAYLNGKLYMFFGANNPNNYTVKVSIIDKNVYSNYKSYLTFSNISFEGANIYGIHQVGGSNLAVLDCNIDYIGTTGVFVNSSSNATINRCRFTNINDNAFHSTSNSPNTYFGNCIVRNCAMIPGATGSGDLHGFGVFLQGENETVEYNTTSVMGYLGMYVSGNNLLVRNNVIDSVCLVKDDGGSIYINGYLETIMSNRIIENNIITNAIGNNDGANSTVPEAYGIYPDGYANNINIRNNTVSKCTNTGIFLGFYTHHINVLNNTLIDNTSNLYITDQNTTVNNMVINGNTFATTTTNKLINLISASNSIESIGTWDSNYYIKPFDDKGIAFSQLSSSKSIVKGYTVNSFFDKHPNSPTVAITPYVINSLIGSNKFSNGAFTSNISGAAYYYKDGNASLSWDNTNKINGGSVKISYNTPSTSTNICQLKLSVGALKSNTKYILKYDILGTKSNCAVSIFLKYGAAYYTDRYKYQPYTNSISHIEMLLEPNAAAVAELFFEFNDEDGTVYIDNVEFYEADVSKANPNNFVLFEYATSTTRTISLSGLWKTLLNENVSGSITLQPYSSVILVKSTESNQNPIIYDQSLLINENSANGTLAGTVVASDPDAGQTKTFSIVSGNTNGAFAINASTGAITVASSAALNFETNPTFPLVVKVQDNGSPALSSQATVSISLTDVNELPVISNQSFSVAENASNGTLAGTVVATDPDAGQTKAMKTIHILITILCQHFHLV